MLRFGGVFDHFGAVFNRFGDVSDRFFEDSASFNPSPILVALDGKFLDRLFWCFNFACGGTIF